MKKPKSQVIFDESDFPISIIRQHTFMGTGVDIKEPAAKLIMVIAIVGK